MGYFSNIRNILQPTILSPVFINPLVALPGRILVGLIIGSWLKTLGNHAQPTLHMAPLVLLIHQ